MGRVIIPVECEAIWKKVRVVGYNIEKNKKKNDKYV